MPPYVLPVGSNITAGYRAVGEGDFCHFPRHSTPFTQWEKFTLSGGPELERALRFLDKKVSGFSLNHAEFDLHPISLADAVTFYASLALNEDPKHFFEPPTAKARVCEALPNRLTHGEVLDISFQSDFVPRFPQFRDEFLTYAENRSVHARVWRHPPGQSLGSLIAIHGWSMGDQRVNALALVPGFFFRLGFDVALYELPYHGRRAPKGNSHGSLFPSAHVARTNEAIAQAIFDLRLLAEWLHDSTAKPVGAIGVSLGGYVAALWAALDKLSFVVPMFPLVSMADIAWRILSSRNSAQSGGEDALSAVTHEQLEEAYAIHCPLSYTPLVEQNRRFIIAGLGDSIIPPEQPQSLGKHWEEPEMYWFSGGHIGHSNQQEVLNRLHQFFLSLGLAHAEPLQVRLE